MLGEPIELTSLVWSRNNRRLAFLNTLITNPGAGLYKFHIDSNKTYKHLNCDNSGVKYYMRWVGNDTLVYQTLPSILIYGYNANLITTSVQNIKTIKVPHTIQIYNFPNPFNPVTTIKYDLPKTSEVELVVYDILGRKVKTIVNQTQQAGKYETRFYASKLASGIYIHRISTKDFVNSKKIILLK